VSLCSKSPALEQYIAHQSNVCTILATGTGPFCLSPFNDYFMQACDLDPDFCPSRLRDLGSLIPDPKTATNEMVKKKMWATSQRIIDFFTKIIVIKLSKI
jgi:hypothetical protein